MKAGSDRALDRDCILCSYVSRIALRWILRVLAPNSYRVSHVTPGAIGFDDRRDADPVPCISAQHAVLFVDSESNINMYFCGKERARCLRATVP